MEAGVIDVNRLVETFLTLVRIDSPTYDERRIVEHLANEFAALGLPATSDRTGRDGAGNLHVWLPGSRSDVPPLMLSAHTDTVEPGRGVAPSVVDGVVRTDGRTVLGADNKAGVAAILEAVRVITSGRAPHRAVDIVLTWGEERGHAGAAAFDVSRLRTTMGVTMDGEGAPGHVTVAAPTYYSVHARFLGKAAHAGVAPERGVNAIAAAAHAIAGMTLGRLDHETTANVGLIRGGTARNAVPAAVDVEGEARSLDPVKVDAVVASLREALDAGARAVGASVDVTVTKEYGGYRLSAGEPVVDDVTAAIERAGLTPVLAPSGGGSDANTFSEKGLRCVNLGIGMKDIHTVKEHIAVADLEKTCALVLELMRGPLPAR
jgi:tripeptide aminopeptidase